MKSHEVLARKIAREGRLIKLACARVETFTTRVSRSKKQKAAEQLARAIKWRAAVQARFDALVAESEALLCPKCRDPLAVTSESLHVVCVCGYRARTATTVELLKSYGQVIHQKIDIGD